MKKKITVEKKQQVELAPDTPEYRIAVVQLHKLEQIAMERLLSREEAQLYDILCKNLNLAKGDPTVIKGEYTKIEGEISEKDLMKIATSELSDGIAKEIKKVTGSN
jgi:hypothetical protein